MIHDPTLFDHRLRQKLTGAPIRSLPVKRGRVVSPVEELYELAVADGSLLVCDLNSLGVSSASAAYGSVRYSQQNSSGREATVKSVSSQAIITGYAAGGAEPNANSQGLVESPPVYPETHFHCGRCE